MCKPDIILTIEPLIDVFRDLKIPYCISGSVASSAKGIPRTTIDVDIVTIIPPGLVSALEKKLANTYYISKEAVIDAIKNQSSFNLIHLETLIKVDVYMMKTNAYDIVAFSRKSTDSINNEHPEEQFYMASSEDIILSKLNWYKMGFEVSERQWDDIIGVLKIQKDSLDFDYLQKWAANLKITDLLTKAYQQTDIYPLK